MSKSQNAETILQRRYYKKDSEGNILEDWEGMVHRVSKNISQDAPENYKKFYDLLYLEYFLPNSPTLMNAGNDLQQLSACFVLPIEDSMESIFTSIKNAALIHKSGGGTGFSFSRLREANSRVKTTSGVSSGPLSFLKVFNSATDAVKQGGTRRGANMGILNVTHPQILEFIQCKENNNELTNFNLSVGITEEFMRAVFQNEDYALISPHKNEVHSTLNARDVFMQIVHMSHKNGEPGIIFIDRINEFNPTPHIGQIESTNPCGEQPLLPNEACNLGSINLIKIYKNALHNDGTSSSNDLINYELLKQIVRDSVDFLDCVIDQSQFPLPEIREMVKANRKIGLGVMGWAELLFKLRIPYNSQEAIDLAEDIMEFIDYHAKERSMELALEKGSFPNFKGSIYDKATLKRKNNKKDWDSLITKIQKNGIRNATVTTIAPTGTISMLCNSSSGIEPHFSLAFVKQVMDNDRLVYANDVLKDAVTEWINEHKPYLTSEELEDNQENCENYTKKLFQRIVEDGTLNKISEIPNVLKRVFITSHEITPEWHIKMQAAFQKYTDNAVSKTINFPNHATKEDIKIALEMAYTLNCKGITVYRDGSRKDQPLQSGNQSNHDMQKKIEPRIRPGITAGITQRIDTGCGHVYVTINSDDVGACEIFLQMGKVGGCPSAQLEAIGRLASMALRANVSSGAIIRQLKSIRCPQVKWHKRRLITSCADAIAFALENFQIIKDRGMINGSIDISTMTQVNTQKDINAIEYENNASGQGCPECGSNLQHSEGCVKCPTCDWSRC